jgi:hypothetical protein
MYLADAGAEEHVHLSSSSSSSSVDTSSATAVLQLSPADSRELPGVNKVQLIVHLKVSP